jgi:glycosyltransferase involved in cell wall biosynthesis
VYRELRVGVVIPAVDEADAIGPVLDAIDREIVDVVVVADNGSADRTADVARAHGAHVVIEPRRGYGSACLKALAAPEIAGVDVVVFLDGDGSDDPREIPLVIDPIADERCAIVIGSRVLGNADPGALTPVQRFGNALTCRLVWWFFRVRYTDLGPFRAITAGALRALEMCDPDFGWTIEMQVKAAQRKMSVVEVPVSRAVRQAGVSKVSGSLSGSWRAGVRILSYVFSAKFG